VALLVLVLGATLLGSGAATAAAYSLSVTVTHSGIPATGGCIELVDDQGNTITTQCVAADGIATFTDVAPAQYRVLAQGFGDAVASTWYGGSADWAHAAWVTIGSAPTTEITMALGQGGSISALAVGTALEGGADAALYTSHGSYVSTVAVGSDGTFRFASVPAGSYKIRIWPYGTDIGGWVKEDHLLTPRIITLPTASGSWDVNGFGINISNTTGGSAITGRLNVPKSFTGSTVCVLAVWAKSAAPSELHGNNNSNVADADCGAPGDPFELEPMSARQQFWIVFTDGKVASESAWDKFRGRLAWYGNQISAAKTPVLSLPDKGFYYLPVYFFKDVTSSTLGYQNIQWMGDSGISEGYSDGSYKPDTGVIRKYMALFLWRFAGRVAPDPVVTSPYTDVEVTDPGANAMFWMKQQGIDTGSAYRPDALLTRKEMALFLYRLAGSPSFTAPSKSPFSDVKTTDPAYTAITWLVTNHIVSGYTDGTYKPSKGVTRKTMATFLYHYYDNIGDPSAPAS